MIINAKQELLKIVNDNNITILKIDINYYGDVDFDNKGKTVTKHITSLDELDFDYDAGYGVQDLYGIVYCKASNDNPVWLTRGEYDGSEWWTINTIPEFYNTIK